MPTPRGTVSLDIVPDEVVVCECSTPMSAVALTVGRYPDNACGTVSSIARTRARSALSCGLLP
jgi:hypothetical protein